MISCLILSVVYSHKAHKYYDSKSNLKIQNQTLPDKDTVPYLIPDTFLGFRQSCLIRFYGDWIRDKCLIMHYSSILSFIRLVIVQI